MDGTTAARRVLVVEDEPLVRETIREALAYEGYDVREAANGQEALEALGAARPDAIVLDLWMPVMDGWQFRSAQLARHPGIPLIVLSALDVSNGRLAELRADALVAKPFELDALYQAVSQVIAARP